MKILMNSIATLVILSNSVVSVGYTDTHKTVKEEKVIVQESKHVDNNYIEKEFKLTAYCPCTKCSGKWGNSTASGKKAKSDHTVAVDRNVIPLGTEIEINGKKYMAEDVGGGVKGNHIDIYFNTHQETVEFGVKYEDVKIYKEDQ